MYSIKQEHNFKRHKKISNNMHYRMIRHFSVNIAVVTLVTTLMLMPPHIFASDRVWATEWNDNSGQEGNNFTPVQETTGPDWNDICNKISFALISPCSDLVNPDNTLTRQGEHVKGCIQNGAVLAGAALLLIFPPTAILSTLPMIAPLGGCEDVINFGTVIQEQRLLEDRAGVKPWRTFTGFIISTRSAENILRTLDRKKTTYQREDPSITSCMLWD
jgi:hypothetical protein